MPILILDEQTKDWKEISRKEKNSMPIEERKKTLFLAQKLKEKLDFAIEQQNRDNDVVGIIAGDEGSGKSAIAGNCMRYVSKDTFNPKKQLIGSDYDDAIDKIKDIHSKGALMFDEGVVFFLSTEIMKRESRDLHKIFSIFRQKNLFVLIILPSYFRLGTYWAIDRSNFLIRTYLKNGKRDRFAYYGEKTKEKLYRIGKKMNNYQAIQPNFRGRFEPCSTLESQEYKVFKLKTLTNSLKVAKKKKVITASEGKQRYMKELINKNPEISSNELSKILGITYRWVHKIRTDTKDSLIHNSPTIQQELLRKSLNL